MTACLWNDIDTYLVTGLRQTLMAGGAYTDLHVAQIEAGESFDPDHVALPFVLVRGLEFIPGDEGPHYGEGVLRLDDNRYPYELVMLLTCDDYSTARSQIKELARRCLAYLRVHPSLDGLMSTEREAVTRLALGATQIEVRGPIGDNQGPYSALATVSFDVYTEIH